MFYCCCLVKLHGPDRTDFLETLVVGDIAVLNENQSVLSLITNETGGIIDDTIITNQGKNISMVVNGACKHKDIAHMKEQLSAFQAKGKEVEMEIIDDHQMFALQGPKAMDVLASYVKQSGVDLVHMPFMTALPMTLLGIPCQVTRCGYTGEDGCEISVPTYGAVELWDSLTANEAVHATGLGARDSLRLEAGLCLYGNDATSETSPVEAGLNWTIGKRRRVEGGFIGEEVILEQLKNGITRRRMAFEVTKGAPARGGEAIVDKETGEEVGFVTSGGFGPTVGKSIGMGYCNKPWNKTGTEIAFKVRNKLSHAIVRKMPIVPAQYYKVPE